MNDRKDTKAACASKFHTRNRDNIYEAGIPFAEQIRIQKPEGGELMYPLGYLGQPIIFAYCPECGGKVL